MEKTFQIDTKDGRSFEINAPDNMPDSEVYASAYKALGITAPSSEISPDRLAARQATSKAEFETNNESTLSSRSREAAIGIAEPFTAQAVGGMVTGAGRALLDMVSGKGSAKAQEMIKGAIMAPVEPVKNWVGGIYSGDYNRAAYGAGGILSQTVPAVAGIPSLAKIGIKGGKLVIKKSLPAVETLQRYATTAKQQALAPTTKQARWDAALVGEELSQKQIGGGIRSKTIDANFQKAAESAGEKVGAVENYLSSQNKSSFQFNKSTLMNGIQSLRDKLRVPGTDAVIRTSADAYLNNLREMLDKIPDNANFDQTIALRRLLDNAAEDVGAFGPNADKLNAALHRGMADLVRTQLNEASPQLKSANHDYMVTRKAADAVLERQSANVGKIGSGLPGRASVLDDILVTWAGNALGGPMAGAIAGLTNLARQTRGWANIKSGAWQRLANLKRGTVTALPENTMVPSMSESPPSSIMKIGTREAFDELKASSDSSFTSSYRPKSGPAKGFILDGIEVGLAGNDLAYIYRNTKTGKTLRFLEPQQ